MILGIGRVRKGVADQVKGNGDDGKHDGRENQLIALRGGNQLAPGIDQVAQRRRADGQAQADIGNEYLAANRPGNGQRHAQGDHRYQIRQQIARDDALRTPEQRFEALGLPEAGQYLNVDGLRLHYQEYNPTGEQVLLLLHASPFWGYAYYDAAQQAAQAGWRVLVPDWLGFGRSDKPKKTRWYSVAQQAQALQQLLAHLNIPKAYYAGQGLGVAVAQALPELLQPCSQGNWQVSALTQQLQHPVWQAPYPDKGHQAALQVFKARM